MSIILKLSLFASLAFSLSAFATKDPTIVDQTAKVVSIDKTIRVVLDGVAQTWTINFDQTKLEISLSSDGQSNYSFNHFSMCMGRDIGALAAPFSFTTIDEKGATHQVTVEPSTEAKPVHVSAVCPKPGLIDELYLSSTTPDLFPTDLKALMQAQLQARVQEIAQNAKLLEAARSNGLANRYVLIRPESVCASTYDGTKTCDYRFVGELTLDPYGPDRDGFVETKFELGALPEAELKSYSDDNAKNTSRHRDLSSTTSLQARQNPPTNPVHFNEDGTMDIAYGSGEKYGYSNDQIAASTNCVLHAKLIDGGKKLRFENVRNAQCRAQLPYINLLSESFEMTKDE